MSDQDQPPNVSKLKAVDPDDNVLPDPPEVDENEDYGMVELEVLYQDQDVAHWWQMPQTAVVFSDGGQVIAIQWLEGDEEDKQMVVLNIDMSKVLYMKWAGSEKAIEVMRLTTNKVRRSGGGPQEIGGQEWGPIVEL